MSTSLLGKFSDAGMLRNRSFVQASLGTGRTVHGLCDYNNILFPLELELGAVLHIPSAEHASMRLID